MIAFALLGLITIGIVIVFGLHYIYYNVSFKDKKDSDE